MKQPTLLLCFGSGLWLKHIFDFRIKFYIRQKVSEANVIQNLLNTEYVVVRLRNYEVTKFQNELVYFLKTFYY